jgi:hypothetical protein
VLGWLRYWWWNRQQERAAARLRGDIQALEPGDPVRRGLEEDLRRLDDGIAARYVARRTA